MAFGEATAETLCRWFAPAAFPDWLGIDVGQGEPVGDSQPDAGTPCETPARPCAGCPWGLPPPRTKGGVSGVRWLAARRRNAQSPFSFSSSLPRESVANARADRLPGEPSPSSSRQSLHETASEALFSRQRLQKMPQVVSLTSRSFTESPRQGNTCGQMHNGSQPHSRCRIVLASLP